MLTGAREQPERVHRPCGGLWLATSGRKTAKMSSHCNDTPHSRRKSLPSSLTHTHGNTLNPHFRIPFVLGSLCSTGFAIFRFTPSRDGTRYRYERAGKVLLPSIDFQPVGLSVTIGIMYVVNQLGYSTVVKPLAGWQLGKATTVAQTE